MDQEKKEYLRALKTTLETIDESDMCPSCFKNVSYCANCIFRNEDVQNKTIQALEEAINE